MVGLQKYAGDASRRRRSTPKLAVHNTALASAVAGRTLEDTRADPEAWGRSVEAAVGAHLLGRARLDHGAVYYWRTRVRGFNVEVDYVTVRGPEVTAIEVKSGATIGSLEGLAAFREAFGPSVVTALVGTGGVPVEEFLSQETTLAQR